VVDPEGYVVATMSGEGHADAIGRLVEELVTRHEAAGTLHRGDGPYVPPPPHATSLRFPGKLLALPGGTLLVSDTRHHSVVELAADGETVLRRVGAGERGRADGGPDQARFSEPQGLALLPPDVAERVGYDVVVADTVNHLLRGVRLATGEVRTIAGTGRPWRSPDRPAAPLEQDLSSPWDVAWWQGRLIVAMAGIHQLWSFDPRSGELGPYAGTTVEGLRDGPVADAWFAQPSGLAADGKRLWVADSETSSLRYVEDDQVHTAVGQGLFDFGHRDGPATEALFQHPLGVTVLPDGSVAVFDTYNDAVRRYEPATGEVSTLATEVREPSAGVVVGGDLVVVESAAHRLTRPLAPGTSRRILGRAQQTHRPVSDIGAGAVTLDVVFEVAAGQKLDERYGPATSLTVSASPPELVVDGAGESAELRRTLQIAGHVSHGVLHVTAQAASCDVDVPHPACHLTRQDWGVPVRVVDGGPHRLGLVLRGMDRDDAE
jgi:hypothetical protein